MRAIQIEEFGGPEVLQLADVPVPEPGEDEVLIRVSRAGMNYADTHQRTNSYLARYELPLVPGGEVAGVREDTGERVVAMCGLGGYAEWATAPRSRSSSRDSPPGTCTAPRRSWRPESPSSCTPPRVAWARSRCSWA